MTKRSSKKTAVPKDNTQAKNGMVRVMVYQRITRIIAQGQLIWWQQCPMNSLALEQSRAEAPSVWFEPYQLSGAEVRPTTEKVSGWALLEDEAGVLCLIVQRPGADPSIVIRPVSDFRDYERYMDFIHELHLKLANTKDPAFFEAERAQLTILVTTVLAALTPLQES